MKLGWMMNWPHHRGINPWKQLHSQNMQIRFVECVAHSKRPRLPFTVPLRFCFDSWCSLSLNRGIQLLWMHSHLGQSVHVDNLIWSAYWGIITEKFGRLSLTVLLTPEILLGLGYRCMTSHINRSTRLDVRACTRDIALSSSTVCNWTLPFNVPSFRGDE